MLVEVTIKAIVNMDDAGINCDKELLDMLVDAEEISVVKIDTLLTK